MVEEVEEREAGMIPSAWKKHGAEEALAIEVVCGVIVVEITTIVSNSNAWEKGLS